MYQTIFQVLYGLPTNLKQYGRTGSRWSNTKCSGCFPPPPFCTPPSRPTSPRSQSASSIRQKWTYRFQKVLQQPKPKWGLWPEKKQPQVINILFHLLSKLLLIYLKIVFLAAYSKLLDSLESRHKKATDFTQPNYLKSQSAINFKFKNFSQV